MVNRAKYPRDRGKIGMTSSSSHALSLSIAQGKVKETGSEEWKNSAHIAVGYWTFLGNKMGFLAFARDAIIKYGLFFSISQRFGWTGYTREEPMMMANEVNNLIRLMDAICVSWDNPSYYPEYENGVLKVTHCNAFVNDVAQAVGCDDFYDPLTHEALMADDIIQRMSGSDRWQELRVAGLPPDAQRIALSSVQMWANQGYLTIAGMSSAALGSAHAHVCIVRPGKMKTSGKWGEVPVVANVGKENFIGRGKSGPMKGEPVGVNEAFIQMPRFFSFKG